MEVWKYKLNGYATQTELEMPEGAEILKVDIQHGEPMLWALIEPEARKAKRVIEIYGTGHRIELGVRRFINTFFVNDGVYVFHVFELQK